MEVVLAALAGVVFLGYLGAVDLWGKREQRASAEALDTVDHQHWLVAQIQGRPRLEKPPLPRWTIATLITLTGRRDEWVVRLPSALSALGMVALVYGLGCRLGGRSIGRASALVLTSMGFFVSELRQAGNDGPLAFFTTLALYAAWRRLHGGPVAAGMGGGFLSNDGELHPGTGAPELEDEDGFAQPGHRGWNLVFAGAIGLGFLTKGPIIIVLVALALLPYLALAGRLRPGVRRLADGWGLLLFLFLALCWPVPVLLSDPNAARVWYLEMGQKAGSVGITHHRHHEVLAVEWPLMTAPWILLASTAVFLPFRRSGRLLRPRIWLPWSWALGNLVMFCLWAVAKPNYYLPCLPAVALLVGIEWIRLTQAARDLEAGRAAARRLLQLHWVALFVAAAVAPVVAGQLAPQYLAPVGVFSVVLVAAVIASAWAWRRGADVASLAPLVGAWAVGTLLVYGVLGPPLNPSRSHRALAATLEKILPPETRTVMFFQELDEGLWFYLRDRALVPVPGSQPRYNKGFDLNNDFRNGLLELDPYKRLEAEKQILLKWLSHPGQDTPYVLIRKKFYDPFAPSLVGLAETVHREEGLSRNELVLLRAIPRGKNKVASRPVGGRQ
jgi:4-amino-4-deoxy-L-arabinose transferase-like glycosyltransferase